MKKTLKKSIKESLFKSQNVVRKIEESKKLKESMRRDFYDWYDSLTDYARKKFDDYMADEGYPDMVTDLSNQDIEYLMMEFNPDYFEDEQTDDYDESCKDGICEGKLHPFTKDDWYGYAGAEKFPDGSDPLIYSDPETDNTVIVSYDDYTDDIIVQAILVDDEGEGTSFTKTYQDDRQKAIADAEDIISKGWLSTGNTNAFGSDWEHGIG